MAEPLPLDVDADDQKLLAQVIDYYHATLKNSTEALDYLKKRGITNSEVITQFKLGYADRTLGKLLPIKQLKAGRTIRTRLEQLGLIRASGHEHFAGCIDVPHLRWRWHQQDRGPVRQEDPRHEVEEGNADGHVPDQRKARCLERAGNDRQRQR